MAATETVVVRFTKTVEFAGALRREGVVLTVPKASADFLLCAGEAVIATNDFADMFGSADFLKGFN